MVKLFYTTYISVDLAHQVIFHAKVGKGSINRKNPPPPCADLMRYRHFAAFHLGLHYLP